MDDQNVRTWAVEQAQQICPRRQGEDGERYLARVMTAAKELEAYVGTTPPKPPVSAA